MAKNIIHNIVIAYNLDAEDPVDVIKKETHEKGAICIDAVGFEAVGDMAGNVSDNNGRLINNNSLKGST